MLIKSESTANLTKALVAAKKDFSAILRQKDNPFFKSKYADLAAAIDATEPALGAQGLAISQFNISDGDRVGVLTLLLHESGEYLGESFTLPFAKQDAQSGTAAITYARRSAYLSILCVASEDDDGNTAAGRISKIEDNLKERAKNEKVLTDALKKSRGPVSTKAAQPPKAEIPSEPLGKEAAQSEEAGKPVVSPSSTPPDPATMGQIQAGADDTLPTDEQTQSIRNRFSLLNKDLADAGLEPHKGKPVGRKVTLYLLHRTGMEAADQVTYQQWTKFFEEVGAYKNAPKTDECEGGYATLARIISKFTEEKK